MNELNLQIDEKIIFEKEVNFTNKEIDGKTYQLYLTNFNVILYKKTKKLFSAPQIDIIKLPLNNFNLVDGEPFYQIFEVEDGYKISLIYNREIIDFTFEDYDEDWHSQLLILGNLLSDAIKRLNKVEKSCLICGAIIEEGMRFCKECGNKI